MPAPLRFGPRRHDLETPRHDAQHIAWINRLGRIRQRHAHHVRRPHPTQRSGGNIHRDYHCLVDGMIAMDVPAAPLRRMGATHVVSVALPNPTETVDPRNMLSVVTRCFQIMTSRTESQWRRHSNLVIVPDVCDIGWDSFESAHLCIAAGERAAEAVIPQISRWFAGEAVA